MSKRIIVVALLAGGIGSIAIAWAAEGTAKTVVEVNDAKLTLAKRGFDLFLDAYGKRQRDDINGIARWSKRPVEVLREGKDKAKLQEELAKHRGRMQQLFNLVVTLQKAGEKCELDKVEAEYLLLEAEGWELDAKSASLQ